MSIQESNKLIEQLKNEFAQQQDFSSWDEMLDESNGSIYDSMVDGVLEVAIKRNTRALDSLQKIQDKIRIWEQDNGTSNLSTGIKEIAFPALTSYADAPPMSKFEQAIASVADAAPQESLEDKKIRIASEKADALLKQGDEAINAIKLRIQQEKEGQVTGKNAVPDDRDEIRALAYRNFSWVLNWLKKKDIHGADKDVLIRGLEKAFDELDKTPPPAPSDGPRLVQSGEAGKPPTFETFIEARGREAWHNIESKTNDYRNRLIAECLQGEAGKQPEQQPAPKLVEKFMPVHPADRKLTGDLKEVPFSFLNEEQAFNNHGQTLSRLAERGGLSIAEMLDIVNRQRWSTSGRIPFPEALATLKTKLTKFYSQTDVSGEQPADDPWIPVTKALPKDEKENEVYCLVIDTYWGMVVRPYNQAHNCWDMEDGDDYYTDAVGGKITHWMPLPKGPKAGEQKGGSHD